MTEESKKKLAQALEAEPIDETKVIVHDWEHDGPYVKHLRLA